MSTLQREDVARVARLARIALSDADGARLAPTLEAITRDFGTLADEAARLPPAADDAPGAPRADVVTPAPAPQADAILQNASVDRQDAESEELGLDVGGATRTVRAHE